MGLTLSDRWEQAVAPWAREDAAAYGDALLARWAEPHRRYHDLRHLQEVLEALDALGAPLPSVLAAFWHDAVYDPRAADNEKRSADLARDALVAMGAPPGLVEEVARLVLVTATHVADPGDEAGVLLCDADLAVLGSPPERYAAYAAAVREEYAHVPDADFARGRADVLRALVAPETVYATAAARQRWEDRARANVAAELARLTGGSAAAPPP